MTFNEHNIEEFLSGELPDDHPAWSQTEAFTQRLGSVYPRSDGPVDAASLAAVVDEARQIRTAAALQRNLTPIPMRPSRLALAVAAAAAVAIASGAGLAAALNTGLHPDAASLSAQLPVVPISKVTPTPTPTPEPTEAESEAEAAPFETVKPKVKTTTHHKPKPAAKPAPRKTESHHDDDEGEDHHEDAEDHHEEDHEDED